MAGKNAADTQPSKAWENQERYLRVLHNMDAAIDHSPSPCPPDTLTRKPEDRL